MRASITGINLATYSGAGKRQRRKEVPGAHASLILSEAIFGTFVKMIWRDQTGEDSLSRSSTATGLQRV